MGKKEQDNFFEKQLEHSKAKLALLKNYALVWMRKVTLGTQNRKCLIIDAFAGTGYYEDGSEGSPILLIKEVIKFAKQAKENPSLKFRSVTLIFSEKDKNNFKKLKKNIEELLNQKIEENIFVVLREYPNIRIFIINDSFENFTINLLNEVNEIIPTLMFIDPFGYKTISLSIISKIIKQYDYCELLINFMYEEFNRFLFKEDSEAYIETVKNFYGQNIEYIKEEISKYNPAPRRRREIVINGYKANLKKYGAEYTLDFDIEKNNKVKMTMVFCTKNLYGFDVMKENMFKTCKNIDFEYHTINPQLSFFSETDEEVVVEELSKYIYTNFAGNEVRFKSIKEYSMKHSYIPSYFVKKSLKLLEKNNQISMVSKLDGGKRRKGTFPDDCIVTFVEAKYEM